MDLIFFEMLQKEIERVENFFNDIENENDISEQDKAEIERVVYYSPDRMDKIIPYIEKNKNNLSKMTYLHLTELRAQYDDYELLIYG